MLARLLLSNDPPARAYLSYSISGKRDTDEGREPVDSFRRRIHATTNLVAFDPLAIDELPLINQPASASLEKLPEGLEYFPPGLKKNSF